MSLRFTLSSSSPFHAGPRASRWLPLAVFLVGAVCTAVVVRQLAAAARDRDQQRFEAAARRLQAAVEHRAESHRALLRATAGRLTGENGYTSPEEFHRFLDAMRLADYPGVEAVGYSRRTLRTEISSLEEEARRRKVDANFTVKPVDPARPEYYPVALLDAAEGRSRKGLGFDLFTDPACRAAMEQARDTGEPTATGVVAGAVAREDAGPGQPKFLMFVPVYKKDARPADPKARRAALMGFVCGSVRAGDLFAAVFGAEPSADADFLIYEGPSADGVLLYRSPEYDSAAGGAARFTAAFPIGFAGRTWTLTARSTPAFEAGLEPGRAFGLPVMPAVASGGALVSLLLAGLTALQVRARAAAARSARAAATAADRLELVLKSSGVGLWYSDLPTGRLSWDERAKALFFLAGEPAVTVETALSRVHPDDRDRVLDAMDRSTRDLAPFDVEYRTVGPDGRQTNWLRSVGQPAADEAGAPVRFDVLTTDVTALKGASESAETARVQAEASRAAAEAAREQAEASRSAAETARAEAERAGWVKDEFLATLSHELRTPLNAILGWTQLLRREGGLVPAVDEGLAVIERNARVQAQLVSDLLDMSRIIAGKIRLDVQPVDLAAVAAAAVDSVRPAADAKDITVERVGPDAAGGLTVRGDAGRLQQVAWNLITNAVKFTPDGGRVRVAVTWADSHDGNADGGGPDGGHPHAGPHPRLRLVVCDTGEGIDPAFVPHLFDRFSQADASAARRHGGLGLGLAVVKHLVELHGGRVWAASDGPGRGSTFTVELPAAHPHPADGDRAERADDGTPAADGATTRVLAGLTVLAVDDEPDARELVRRVLAEAGAAVALAAGADEALRLVRDRQPDVLVADIGMPGRDGFALVRAVRSLPPTQGAATPAAALTAFASADDGRRMLAAGYQVHLPKPIDAADLVAAVARLAGRGPAAVADGPSVQSDSRPAGGSSPPEASVSTRRERLGLDGYCS